MPPLTIERSIQIAAPPDRVYQALTDPTQIAGWFMPALPGAALERDASGNLSVMMGPMSAQIARLESLNPPHQATLRSLPDQLIAAIYSLAPHDGGTRLTVTMTGFDSLPADTREDRFNLSGAGWDQALANLKANIDGTELPHPQAFVGPLFAYWREPQEKLAIERSIFIRATRERVWRAITDVKEMAVWFSPSTEWGSDGVDVGNHLWVKDPQSGDVLSMQVIEATDPPRYLVTRTEPDPPATPETTIWTLTEESGGTRVTLTYTGYQLTMDAARRGQFEQNAFGFGMMLQNLQAHIQGESLPFPFGF